MNNITRLCMVDGLAFDSLAERAYSWSTMIGSALGRDSAVHTVPSCVFNVTGSRRQQSPTVNRAQITPAALGHADTRCKWVQNVFPTSIKLHTNL